MERWIGVGVSMFCRMVRSVTGLFVAAVAGGFAVDVTLEAGECHMLGSSTLVIALGVDSLADQNFNGVLILGYVCWRGVVETGACVLEVALARIRVCCRIMSRGVLERMFILMHESSKEERSPPQRSEQLSMSDQHH